VSTDPNDLVRSGYDAFYAAWGNSPTLRQIWRAHVTGPDYPEEFAHISFLTLAQLQSLTEGLSLTTDDVLVDLACGAGGPGFWAAKESGALLVGIDLSTTAVKVAAERAGPLGMAGRATFRQATFETTGLDAVSADAVMSIDALQYVPTRQRRWQRWRGFSVGVDASRSSPSSLIPSVSPGCRSGRIPYRTTDHSSSMSASRSFSTTRSGTGQIRSQQASAQFSPSETLWKQSSVK